MTKYILLRKGIHLLSMFIPLSYFLLSRQKFILLTGILSLIAFIIETLRFKVPLLKQMFYKIFGKLLWKREEKTLTGATTFILSSFICGIFFSKHVAIASLLFLTIGDTIAYFVGTTIGRLKIGKMKSLEGGVASFLICIPFIFVVKIPSSIVIIGNLVSSVVEILPIKMDDNLILPLIAGGIMQLLVLCK